MSLLLDDLKRATRRLRQAPAFTASVLLTISIGTGAFVSIYSVVENVLWEPMPYERPEGLAYIWRDYAWADFPRGWAGGIEILALREGADAFDAIAGVRGGSVNLSSRDGGEPEELQVNLTSSNFFDLLGVQPMLGRGFAASTLR